MWQTTALGAQPIDTSRGITYLPSTARARYVAENNEATGQALAKQLSELRAMSGGIGKPVGEALKIAYQESLQRERRVGQYSKEQIRDARAAVALKHPDVKRDGTIFSRLVAEHLANLN